MLKDSGSSRSSKNDTIMQMAYWAQLFKFIVLWLKINKLELFSELDYWTKLMQLLWVCPAERQNIHPHHQLPSELNPDLSFFSQQQAFTNTDREIALVVALTIASKIVSFKVGFKNHPLWHLTCVLMFEIGANT